MVVVLAAALFAAPVPRLVDAQDGALRPGTRVLLDAHNAYPEHGKWSDRLARALATGLPLAIEQDLVWVRDPRTGLGRSVLSHGGQITGAEPTLEEYFFGQIRPLVERALSVDRRADWPLVTLNLDFKTDEPEHHRAVWDLLGRYESWLVTAVRTASAVDVQPLRPGPLLVLTGAADAQEQSFHDAVPVGATLRLFGAVHLGVDGVPGPKTNYRRWANYAWQAVEHAPKSAAGAWTAADAERLTRLVHAAHQSDLWIRLYSLNGHAPGETSNGWSPDYNFGSVDAAAVRWHAAIAARVDFVAVDQYELFATALHRKQESESVVER
jgi:hypothetical protein